MELRYCYDKGIPHSQFLSWPEEDQDKVVAFILWDGAKCGSCGTNPSDWLDENGHMADDPPFVVGSRMCYGCATLEDAREGVPKGDRSIIQLYLKRPPANERKHRGSPTG